MKQYNANFAAKFKLITMENKMKQFGILAAILTGLASLDANAAVVSGRISDMDGNPLKGVAVSDGNDYAFSDEKGNYALSTDKSNGYVFVVTPGNYEPGTALGNRAKFWQLLTAPDSCDEKADFKLQRIKAEKYAFLTLADIQMGKRINDVTFYNSKSVPDINATIDSLRKAGREPIAITLGDESWDTYWYKNGYALPEVVADMEKIDCRMYHVIGNHDHDPRIEGDEHSSDTWRRIMGPNYYSFNRGKIHFVVLDDIIYDNEGATAAKNGKRNYQDGVTEQQIEWLKKDLSNVSHDTPIVLAMHIPMYTPSGEYALKKGNDLERILSVYDDVRILTGHTHLNYSNRKGSIRENNYGAVCGSWWWTDQPDYGNNSICRDGAPAGYAIWSVDDKELYGQYKGTGLPIDYQFRVYDLNMSEDKAENAILVNVWGWAPGWNIEISENGKKLEVIQLTDRYPLHKISCEIPHIKKGLSNPTTAAPTNHFFKAYPRKKTSSLTVKVTDCEGHVYLQTVCRPKNISTDML